MGDQKVADDVSVMVHCNKKALKADYFEQAAFFTPAIEPNPASRPEAPVCFKVFSLFHKHLLCHQSFLFLSLAFQNIIMNFIFITLIIMMMYC